MSAAIAIAEKTLNSQSMLQMESLKSEKSANNGQDISMNLRVVMFLASISQGIWR